MPFEPTKPPPTEVPVPFTGEEMVDLCPLPRMAHILGCQNVRVSQLVDSGQIPFVMVGGLRMYPVERVLRHVMSIHMRHPPPPLRPGRREKCSRMDDVLWAWDALSAGPWNVKTANTSRAWALYLEAKRHAASRMLLSRMHVLCAHRELSGAKLRADLEKPTDEAEAAVRAEGSHEPEDGAEPVSPPSIFGDLDKAAGSLAVGFEPVPEPVGGETEY